MSLHAGACSVMPWCDPCSRVRVHGGRWLRVCSQKCICTHMHARVRQSTKPALVAHCAVAVALQWAVPSTRACSSNAVIGMYVWLQLCIGRTACPNKQAGRHGPQHAQVSVSSPHAPICTPYHYTHHGPCPRRMSLASEPLLPTACFLSPALAGMLLGEFSATYLACSCCAPMLRALNKHLKLVRVCGRACKRTCVGPYALLCRRTDDNVSQDISSRRDGLCPADLHIP